MIHDSPFRWFWCYRYWDGDSPKEIYVQEAILWDDVQKKRGRPLTLIGATPLEGLRANSTEVIFLSRKKTLWQEYPLTCHSCKWHKLRDNPQTELDDGYCMVHESDMDPDNGACKSYA